MSDANIGKPVPRKEGRAKVTGAARYVDDIDADGMLHGVTVRSSVPRARIKNITFGEGVPWEEFTVVTADDVPGANYVALILNDQPYLADGVVNHAEEPILLLAHEDKYLLEEARRRVHVEYEPLPAVFNIEDSLAKKEVVWGEDNVFKSFLVEKGNIEEAFAEPDLIVVEGEYTTGAQEQLYIETNGVIAEATADSVTVSGSMQCPYYVHKALVKLFNLPEDRVRVVQTETGGGFGGKEEYPSMIAGHAALLALKSGRPVKMIYDRAEDMAATTKRHPSRTRNRIAVTRDGRLVAMDIDFVVDGGAYATLSAVVLSRGTIHAAGPYRCPNVRIRSRAVATNVPPHGAFRGFGAPQSIFALERHLDKVARELGLTPEEFRRRNFITRGETTATGQVVKDEVDFGALLDRAFELSGYREKRERFPRENEGARTKRGVGFATFMHGAGFTGSGEKYLQSIVGCEADAEGRVHVLAASTEIGQGTNTIFAQIAADALGLDYEMVEVSRPDTGNVPNSGPTVASRTTMIVGKLVETAAIQLKDKLIEAGLLESSFTREEWARACAEYNERHGELKSLTQYKQPDDIEWDDEHYRGDAYGAYAWAVYVAEVSVDTVTYEARVEDFVAVQEVGRVIHPVLAAGQIEGGVAQGIGWTLYENVVWQGGRMANGQMTNYIIPTSADIPPIRVDFFEHPYAGGPGGAKGIGELPMDGPAPAILNAVEQALGLPFDHVPLTPENIMDALEGETVTA
ncbi:MAG TPA: xanthine dehydrogenase family protein molybdopterin-binding subunit [Pyrinomonadaceae bacterium]|jgi:CO/xanthine dehydrogenase Mo-binding subunit|nr:xanthine dehydrogenase family protein molybdopterin-binding subunit [Pyrinomonadaceae bacterium]